MKKVRFIIFSLLLLFVSSFNVYASSINIKSSSSSVNRGSSVTITANVSADSGIYTVAGSVYCSGAGVNNGIDLSYEDLNTNSRSLSRSVKITPSASGNITCKTQNVRLRELAKDGEYSLGNSSITISVTNNNSSGGTGTTRETEQEIKEKSSDNNLSSLSVEGYDIDPKFAKDKLEYTLTVDEKIEIIKVNAKASDSKAEVKGIGEVKLSSGKNTIEVKVIAENGNEKVYKIIVNVEDQHPINVKVNGSDYVVVKKNNDLIEKPEEFEETTIKIDNQDVVAYKNNKINVVLVILKDSNNKLSYYIYKNNSYEKYKYIKLSGINLQLLDFKGILEGYSKYKIKIQNQDVDIYKLKESHKVGLIYGTNVKTGNTDFYVYDELENTLSKYYDEEVLLYKEKLKSMKNYFMIFMGIIAFIAIITIIGSLIYSKKKRKFRYK